MSMDYFEGNDFDWDEEAMAVPPESVTLLGTQWLYTLGDPVTVNGGTYASITRSTTPMWRSAGNPVGTQSSFASLFVNPRASIHDSVIVEVE